MKKFLYRPILTFSTFTCIVAIIYGLYNASLPGGQGGMIGGVAFAVAIFAGLTTAIENFLVKNSATTRKEILLTESILLVIGITIIYWTLR